jgi:hypothetical protein
MGYYLLAIIVIGIVMFALLLLALRGRRTP